MCQEKKLSLPQIIFIMATTNIIHLQLKDTDEHYYFGCLRALTDMFRKDAIGITYGSLRSCISLNNQSTNKNGVIFENKKCIIRKGEFHTKETNRGQGGRNKPTEQSL